MVFDLMEGCVGRNGKGKEREGKGREELEKGQKRIYPTYRKATMYSSARFVLHCSVRARLLRLDRRPRFHTRSRALCRNGGASALVLRIELRFRLRGVATGLGWYCVKMKVGRRSEDVGGGDDGFCLCCNLLLSVLILARLSIVF